MPTSAPPTNLRDLRPARVCVIKPSALGDVVNAFFALSALREHWPGASFTWVINKNLRGLVEGRVIGGDCIATGAGDRERVGGGAGERPQFHRHP